MSCAHCRGLVDRTDAISLRRDGHLSWFCTWSCVKASERGEHRATLDWGGMLLAARPLFSGYLPINREERSA